MPAGMSFVQLEGNYVISFRDMNECLPAFTAVKLDRRRGSWDGGDTGNGSVPGSTTNLAASLGAGPRRASMFSSTGNLAGGGGTLGGGGSLTDVAAARRKSSATAATPYKLVLTGVPRGVGVDVIRGRLEPVITGIEKVYRDPDMARNLSHPPVFVETRSALAQEAFMLKAEWVPVMQRLIAETNAPAASRDEGIGLSYTASSALGSAEVRADDQDAAEEERRRRQSLVDTLVACPHGRYHGQATCPLCRNSARRNTMVADDIVGHNVEGVVPWRPAPAPRLDERRPTPTAALPPQKKPTSSCASCIACLRRLVPGKRRKPVREDDDEDDVREEQVADQKQAPKEAADNLLDPNFLAAIKNKRRLSAYDDVPVIKIDEVAEVK